MKPIYLWPSKKGPPQLHEKNDRLRAHRKYLFKKQVRTIPCRKDSPVVRSKCQHLHQVLKSPPRPSTMFRNHFMHIFIFFAIMVNLTNPGRGNYYVSIVRQILQVETSWNFSIFQMLQKWLLFSSETRDDHVVYFDIFYPGMQQQDELYRQKLGWGFSCTVVMGSVLSFFGEWQTWSERGRGSTLKYYIYNFIPSQFHMMFPWFRI